MKETTIYSPYERPQISKIDDTIYLLDAIMSERCLKFLTAAGCHVGCRLLADTVSTQGGGVLCYVSHGIVNNPFFANVSFILHDKTRTQNLCTVTIPILLTRVNLQSSSKRFKPVALTRNRPFGVLRNCNNLLLHTVPVSCII